VDNFVDKVDQMPREASIYADIAKLPKQKAKNNVFEINCLRNRA